MDRRVVGILDFLQKFAVVVEQAGDTAVDDQFLQDSHRQMSLAGADLADNHQPFIAVRVALLGKIRGYEMGFCQRRMSAGEVGVVVGQFAVLVATRDACPGKQPIRPRPQLAVAARDPAVVYTRAIRARRRCLPSRALAQRANLCRSLNHLGSTLTSRILF